MSIKFLASEFSPKVKAYNSIEENILRHRLNAYRKQEKNNLRMIDKDTKKFQEDLSDKFRIAKNNSTNGILNESDGFATEIEHYSDLSRSQKTIAKLDKPRKKRKKKSMKRDRDKKTSLDTSTSETFLYKSTTDGENDKMQRSTRYRSPCFLPKLHVSSSTDMISNTKSVKTSNNYLSLPPINNTSLTSSVSLPSLDKFHKKL